MLTKIVFAIFLVFSSIGFSNTGSVVDLGPGELLPPDISELPGPNTGTGDLCPAYVNPNGGAFIGEAALTDRKIQCDVACESSHASGSTNPNPVALDHCYNKCKIGFCPPGGTDSTAYFDAQNDEQKAVRTALIASVNQAEGEIDDLVKDIAAKETEKEDLETEQSKVDSDRMAAQNELQQLETQVAEGKQTNITLDKIKSLRSRIETLNQKTVEIAAQKATVQNEISTLAGELQELETEKISKLNGLEIVNTKIQNIRIAKEALIERLIRDRDSGSSGGGGLLGDFSRGIEAIASGNVDLESAVPLEFPELSQDRQDLISRVLSNPASIGSTLPSVEEIGIGNPLERLAKGSSGLDIPTVDELGKKWGKEISDFWKDPSKTFGPIVGKDVSKAIGSVISAPSIAGTFEEISDTIDQIAGTGGDRCGIFAEGSRCGQYKGAQCSLEDNPIEYNQRLHRFSENSGDWYINWWDFGEHESYGNAIKACYELHFPILISNRHNAWSQFYNDDVDGFVKSFVALRNEVHELSRPLKNRFASDSQSLYLTSRADLSSTWYFTVCNDTSAEVFIGDLAVDVDSSFFNPVYTSDAWWQRGNNRFVDLVKADGSFVSGARSYLQKGDCIAYEGWKIDESVADYKVLVNPRNSINKVNGSPNWCAPDSFNVQFDSEVGFSSNGLQSNLCPDGASYYTAFQMNPVNHGYNERKIRKNKAFHITNNMFVDLKEPTPTIETTVKDDVPVDPVEITVSEGETWIESKERFTEKDRQCDVQVPIANCKEEIRNLLSKKNPLSWGSNDLFVLKKACAIDVSQEDKNDLAGCQIMITPHTAAQTEYLNTIESIKEFFELHKAWKIELEEKYLENYVDFVNKSDVEDRNRDIASNFYGYFRPIVEEKNENGVRVNSLTEIIARTRTVLDRNVVGHLGSGDFEAARYETGIWFQSIFQTLNRSFVEYYGSDKEDGFPIVNGQFFSATFPELRTISDSLGVLEGYFLKENLDPARFYASGWPKWIALDVIQKALANFGIIYGRSYKIKNAVELLLAEVIKNNNDLLNQEEKKRILAEGLRFFAEAFKGDVLRNYSDKQMEALEPELLILLEGLVSVASLKQELKCLPGAIALDVAGDLFEAIIGRSSCNPAKELTTFERGLATLSVFVPVVSGPMLRAALKASEAADPVVKALVDRSDEIAELINSYGFDSKELVAVLEDAFRRANPSCFSSNSSACSDVLDLFKGYTKDILEYAKSGEWSKIFDKIQPADFFSNSELMQKLRIDMKIPSTWDEKVTKDGKGLRFAKPGTSRADEIRIMPPNFDLPFDTAQVPNVRLKKDGKWRDKDGNIVELQSDESHIPLEDFSFPDWL